MEVSQALDKLRQLCSRQEKSPADARALLKRWGVEAEAADHIIKQIKAERFIDEYRYTSAFVRDKIRFDHWGMIKIRYFLHHKNIPGDIAEKAIGEFDREEYREMVGREIAKKRKTLKGGGPREIWAKLVRYGSSRGYEMEIMQEFLGNDTDG